MIDRTRCVGVGNCEAMAPEMFEIGEDAVVGLLREDVPDTSLARLAAAVDGCPSSALRLQHD
jgi:ferredoxin